MTAPHHRLLDEGLMKLYYHRHKPDDEIFTAHLRPTYDDEDL